jgi:homoserine/homoserine lactone efflux protein
MRRSYRIGRGAGLARGVKSTVSTAFKQGKSMSFVTWIAFVLAACIIAISPGSGAVLSMSHGLAYGVRKTSATIFGLQAGLIVLLVIAGAGIGSLLLASEVAFTIVKTAGALYLIYLGLCQWRAKVADPLAGATTVQGALQSAPPSLRQRFLTGFLTNITNPKGVIFMVAVLPQFITPTRPMLLQLLILGVTMCAIDLAVMHSYAFLASAMQRFFRDASAVRSQNRFFGGILMAVGAGLFFVKRVNQA